MSSKALCPRCQTPKTGKRCKPCANQYRRQYYRDNVAWKRQGIRITWDEYEALIAAQNNLCAICHQPSTDGRALHVDHDHNTGQVRALLCSNCNLALGNAQENPDLLRTMADYLEQHRQTDPVLPSAVRHLDQRITTDSGPLLL